VGVARQGQRRRRVVVGVAHCDGIYSLAVWSRQSLQISSAAALVNVSHRKSQRRERAGSWCRRGEDAGILHEESDKQAFSQKLESKIMGKTK